MSLRTRRPDKPKAPESAFSILTIREACRLAGVPEDVLARVKDTPGEHATLHAKLNKALSESQNHTEPPEGRESPT